jgi:hypothetical protein
MILAAKVRARIIRRAGVPMKTAVLPMNASADNPGYLERRTLAIPKWHSKLKRLW